jgi:hypothetical protein
MNGKDLRAIRKRLFLTKLAFGRLLGYSAERNPLVVLIHRMENGRKPIPLYIARLAWMIDQCHQDRGHTPTWPEGLREEIIDVGHKASVVAASAGGDSQPPSSD